MLPPPGQVLPGCNEKGKRSLIIFITSSHPISLRTDFCLVSSAVNMITHLQANILPFWNIFKLYFLCTHFRMVTETGLLWFVAYLKHHFVRWKQSGWMSHISYRGMWAICLRHNCSMEKCYSIVHWFPWSSILGLCFSNYLYISIISNFVFYTGNSQCY